MTDQFSLSWNNYQNSITTAFNTLREDEDFVDVTLSAEGKTLKAHKASFGIRTIISHAPLRLKSPLTSLSAA